MPKSKPVRAKPTKKQLSRRRREERQLRWIWIGLVAIAAVIVGLVGVSLVTQATQNVAVVNGTPIKVSDYQKRVRYYYYALGPDVFQSNEGQDPNAIHQMIVDQLIEEELIRQEAAKRDISATPDEIELELEQTWFQHYRDAPAPTATPTADPSATPTPEGATPQPTPTPDTQETYQANYDLFVKNVLNMARVSESYVRRMAEVNVLRDKLQQAVVTDVPTEEEQVHFRYEAVADADAATQRISEYQAGERLEVHARHILVDTVEEAQAVLQRLAEGEDFAALAAELSTDTSNKDDGGDLGWFGRGQMVDAFDQVVFEADIGLYPEPVQTDFGYHVIEILAREMRPVSPEDTMYDVGWYGKDELSSQFGPLFAEIIFQAEPGLVPDPVPTDYGTAVIQVIEHAVRQLDQTEQDNRRQQMFQDWLTSLHEEGNIENNWAPSMIPSRM
ncbi:MAG: peptidylprolyl isomerase [Anaerolineae bacterium]|jgi:parvulin-like peptidyl-prolyl isomerase